MIFNEFSMILIYLLTKILRFCFSWDEHLGWNGSHGGFRSSRLVQNKSPMVPWGFGLFFFTWKTIEIHVKTKWILFWASRTLAFSRELLYKRLAPNHQMRHVSIQLLIFPTGQFLAGSKWGISGIRVGIPAGIWRIVGRSKRSRLRRCAA